MTENTDSNSNTLVPVSQAPTPALLAAYDKYGRSAGGFYGDLLKFSGKTGEWTAGPQGVEIPIGTQLVAIVPEMLVGFAQWKDGELVEQEMVPITPDYDAKALRASLGDTDRTAWEKGEDGERIDPWDEAVLLPMKNLKTGAEYTFSTFSVGGVRCVKQLVRAYSKQIQAVPETTAGHLPIVELGANSYKHKKKERGTIYNPLLTGIDWVHASEIANKPRQERPSSEEPAQTKFAEPAPPSNPNAKTVPAAAVAAATVLRYRDGAALGGRPQLHQKLDRRKRAAAARHH